MFNEDLLASGSFESVRLSFGVLVPGLIHACLYFSHARLSLVVRLARPGSPAGSA
jgi:hypothetical protein